MIDLEALNFGAAFPAVSLALGACILFIVDLSVPKDRKHITANLALVGVVVSFLISATGLNASETAFYGRFLVDSFTALVNLIALVTAFISILIAQDYLKRTNINRGEYYPLLLLTTAGVMLMGSAGDLIVLLIALELLSIPLYVMAGFRRPDARSEESAMKYFLLGAFASGFLIYGIALMYGASGTTDLARIFEQVQAGTLTAPFLMLLGAGLVLVAMGFKVAVVPFHMWTPDVYQGAPTAVTAYMSVAAKIGGFAGLLRVLTIAIPSFVVGDLAVEPGQTLVVHAAWQDVVAVLAGLTMILANVIAILQTDIKRLLAYSSIAHAGYLMMAVAAAGSFQVTADDFGALSYSFLIGQEAVQGAMIYLIAYAFTNVGAFAVAIAVERDDASGTLIDDFAGLGRAHPLLAGAMTVFMLSLVGIPLTGGFVGKWFVFFSAVNANLTALVLIGVLTSVISAFYYLRVIVRMWFDVGEGIASTPRSLAWGVGVCAIATLVVGVLPTLVAGLAQSVTLVAMR